MFLELRQVTKRFGTVTAVDRVDLDVALGDFVCFVGPSGCGKTTLLRLIAGLEAPDGGQLLLEGSDLTALPARARNFGMVFQSYSLFPGMNVAENVAYGLRCRRWPRAEIAARVEEMLALVRLGDSGAKLPHQLSGGQQQRIALARALAPRPRLLLLDEPLSALDAKVREELRGEIRLLQSRLGVTTIMVTHDQDEAMEMADRIVVLNAGAIEQVGSAAELYAQPASRFVAEFIGRMNVLSLASGAAQLLAPSLRGGGLIGVRPEHIASAGPEAADAPLAKIERCVFLGNLTRVFVSLQGHRLLVELPGSVEGLASGARLRLRVRPEDIHRLGEGAP